MYVHCAMFMASRENQRFSRQIVKENWPFYQIVRGRPGIGWPKPIQNLSNIFRTAHWPSSNSSLEGNNFYTAETERLMIELQILTIPSKCNVNPFVLPTENFHKPSNTSARFIWKSTMWRFSSLNLTVDHCRNHWIFIIILLNSVVQISTCMQTDMCNCIISARFKQWMGIINLQVILIYWHWTRALQIIYIPNQYHHCAGANNRFDRQFSIEMVQFRMHKCAHKNALVWNMPIAFFWHIEHGWYKAHKVIASADNNVYQCHQALRYRYRYRYRCV